MGEWIMWNVVAAFMALATIIVFIVYAQPYNY